MMKISIAKNGFQPVKWDMDAGQYTSVEASSVLPLLRSSCSIDPGVTLADIFDAVERDGALKEFLSVYSWYDIDAFHAEARKPAQEPLNLPHLKYIEVSKYLDFDDDLAQETLDFSGIGEPYGEGRTRYGIDLTSVSELAPLPVRLNPVAEVRKDGETIARSPASYTLLDVLGEIYWEISFYGNPAQREALLENLLKEAEEIKAGTADLAPLEDDAGAEPIR